MATMRRINLLPIMGPPKAVAGSLPQIYLIELVDDCSTSSHEVLRFYHLSAVAAIEQTP